MNRLEFNLSSRVRLAFNDNGIAVASEAYGEEVRDGIHIFSLGELMRIFGPHITQNSEIPDFFAFTQLIADATEVRTKVVVVDEKKRFVIVDNETHTPFLEGREVIAPHLGRWEGNIHLQRLDSSQHTILAHFRPDGRMDPVVFKTTRPLFYGEHIGRLWAKHFEEGDELTFDFEGGQEEWQRQVAERISMKNS